MSPSSPPPRADFDDETVARPSTRRPKGPTIALVVSGSIAAYKAVEIARLLVKEGVRVVPVLTRGARSTSSARRR